MHKKSEDVASNALVAANESVYNDDLAALVFAKLLGSNYDITMIKNDILLFNLACYYSIHKEKKLMLIATQQALRHGKKAQQFMADTDFKQYWGDVDFQGVLKKWENNAKVDMSPIN